MDKRDVRAGVVGAAMAAAAIVTVYEGKVAVSHAKESVTLVAGETGRADANGVRRGGGAGGTESGSAGETRGAGDSDPLVAANANLAESVRDYKNRLEAIEAQKTAAEKQLADAQKKLAAATNDGAPAVAKNEYDLSPDDWKQLAKEGRVVARMPCGNPDDWNVSPKTLDALGLPASDAQPIHDALQQSAARIWATVRPLCVQALAGDAAIADKLGVTTCEQIIRQFAQQSENTAEETRLVAEVHAGLVPMPTDPKVLGTYGSMMYAMSSESQAIAQQLSQSIGPAAAHDFVFGDQGNWCNSSWGAGPRPQLPPGTLGATAR
jgi:hypothetical protein